MHTLLYLRLLTLVVGVSGADSKQFREVVQRLHSNTWNVASTILMQSILTAILTEAFYNFFHLRSLLQKFSIEKWMKRRNLTPIKQRMIVFQNSVGTGNGSNLYSLPYQQLCGQIANALRNQLESGEGDLLEIFAYNVPPENLEKLKNQNTQNLSEEEQSDLSRIKEQVLNQAEIGLDDLQITLADFLLKVDYAFSVLIAFLILEFLLTVPTRLAVGNYDYEIIFNISISTVSGLLAPTIRNLFVNILYKK
ncbi:MAG: hypothetical protein F6K40_03450 [Okeania sp. SIO3I5]|uniref:hypothetical protein n=1 Tax=Okeania sp. SIO3I5 TaxID=2607805 RepID=UPI0013B68DCA|nr:hypothetical protein [Okeania sp. SIO3I5]NEQ35412.1 hypothetical protein [Okeania sp. SIO3I5]